MDRLAFNSSAAITEMRLARQVLANEMSNMTTTGFKRSFEVSMKAFKAGGEGFDSSYQPQAAHMDFIQLKPGPLIATGRDLDIHMNDHTVLGVQAPNGETAFTRRGDLQVTVDGVLQTGNGHPVMGEGNLSARSTAADEDEIGRNEDYNRIAILAASLKREELLTLDADTILRRLFWEEPVVRFEPQTPRFACSCNRERVSQMIRSLGVAEAESILAERGDIEVGCDFCGQQYRYDAIDAAQLFVPGQPPVPPPSSALQ